MDSQRTVLTNDLHCSGEATHTYNQTHKYTYAPETSNQFEENKKYDTSKFSIHYRYKLSRTKIKGTFDLALLLEEQLLQKAYNTLLFCFHYEKY